MGACLTKHDVDTQGVQPSTSTFTTTWPLDDQSASYEAACHQDPEIGIIDTTIRNRTSHCISTITDGVEVGAMSLDSLRDVTETLLDLNQEVVKVILECKKDVWNDLELFKLVDDFFESSLQMWDFCTTLVRCLKKVRTAEVIINLAVKRFEDEEGEATDVAGPDNDKYSRTLEELRAFRAVEDLFGDDFFQQFRAVYAKQLHMLNRIQSKKKKLNKKLQETKAWKKVSSVIFISGCAIVLICSVVAAAIAAPPMAVALVATASVPLGTMGMWINSLWVKCVHAIKEQKEMVDSINVGTYVAVKDLDNIRVLVDALEIKISALLMGAGIALGKITTTTADNSIENEQIDLTSIRFGMEEVRRRLSAFTKDVEELIEQADRCSHHIKIARTNILKKMIGNPN